ncbi:hypothetical protein Q9251_19220 [Alkalihalobacillus macyae]|uniref:hypothetical protein n=1 Tax=Guptibacillus hwajinpoensis TaxID=208199 RepID=UPI00273BD97B|nr:hypothetical protein [Alkalihalobacillus macyae]MDP4553010.1 hypothetical protein [Alkalihalobacillus macyae]
MKKAGMNGIQRGQAITFRLPSDTPDHILKQLQKLKEEEKRNFSSRIAEYVLDGVTQTIRRDNDAITVPLPKGLSKAQRDWLKHEHSEALLGNIVYQILSDPLRAASLLASFTSNSIDIDQALYLQEEVTNRAVQREASDTIEAPLAASDDDLMNFDWNQAKQEQSSAVEEEEEGADDLLGGFLDRMNK